MLKIKRTYNRRVESKNWSDRLDYIGEIIFEDKIIPVRGELVEFLYQSSVVDPGERHIRTAIFRPWKGGPEVKMRFDYTDPLFCIGSWKLEYCGNKMAEIAAKKIFGIN